MVLPEEQPNFSRVMQHIKWKFTTGYRRIHDVEEDFSPGRSGFVTM